VKLHSTNFDQLPFSRLFKDYISGEGSIHQYFETDLPEIKALVDKVERCSFPHQREKTVELLLEYNRTFDPSDKTIEQIESLNDPNSLTIVTGQQVSLLGGPLFTVYKTITAIIYAKKLQEHTGRTVVPVFWIADEDHDLEEVSSLNLIDKSGAAKISYRLKNFPTAAPSAATVNLADEYDRFVAQVFDEMDDTDFTNMLWTELQKCYHKNRTFSEAYGRWMLKLFGDTGLILAGSNIRGVKEHAKSVLTTAVEKQQHIEAILDDTTYRLTESGYHGQVQIHTSNLFYFNGKGLRQKIQSQKDRWTAGTKKWTDEELLAEIDIKPERFSPNVFLRPLIQDHLLPVAAYVGGPGEIAYYAQMKDLYYIFDKEMPVILPRFSITLFDSAIDRISEQLPFGWKEYNQRIEDLETSFVKKSNNFGIEQIFELWRGHVEQLSMVKKKKISEIDPTLEATAGKATAIYLAELHKLKGKVYKSVKKQDQVQIERIKRMQRNLFPNGNLQEREIAFIYYMNKYGMLLWDKVLELLKDEDPFTHKKIIL